MTGYAAGPQAGSTPVAFDREARGVTGIVVKGFLLSLVTFGIYRFWYMTEIRRFFWSRTVVAGSAGEYTGRGKELFLGFLVALAILVPVYVAVFGLTVLVPPLAIVAGPLSFLVLFLLGQFAIFRGRRYRASRTLWRGIRLGQDGSGLAYAGLAAGWWLLTLLSLGLAFPWQRAALERYRIDHTLVGDSRMASSARGTMVLKPWLLFYLVGLGPLLVGGFLVLAANDFAIPMDLFVPDPDGKPGQTIFNPDYKDTPLETAGLLAASLTAICLPAALLLIPYYRARETRAFLNAARLGEVSLVSTLEARQFYWPYLVYLAASVGLVVVIGVVLGLASVLVAGAGSFGLSQELLGLAFVGLGGLAYLGVLILFAVLYVRLVSVPLWHAVAATTAVVNAPALDGVVASTRRTGSGLNEGLADALDVGGALQIGL